MDFEKLLNELIVSNFFLSNHSEMELGDDSFVGYLAS